MTTGAGSGTGQRSRLRQNIYVSSRKASSTPLRKRIRFCKAIQVLAGGMFAPRLKLSLLTFGLQAYAIIMHCPAKGKQPNNRCCCCQCCSYTIRYSIQYSICCSLRFSSFAIHFRSFNYSFDQSICLCHFSIQSNSTSFIVLEYIVISTTVHLLYISLPGSTLRLPHDFVIYCVLIILPVKVAIGALIKTTPTAITRGSRFVGILYHQLNYSKLCAFWHSELTTITIAFQYKSYYHRITTKKEAYISVDILAYHMGVKYCMHVQRVPYLAEH